MALVQINQGNRLVARGHLILAARKLIEKLFRHGLRFEEAVVLGELVVGGGGRRRFQFHSVHK